MASGALIAAAVGVLALPSAVLAFSAGVGTEPVSGSSPLIDVSGDEVAGNALNLPVAIRSLAKGRLFRFTPAESPTRPDRSITVAVRVDPETARAITVRRKKLPPAVAESQLRIAPTSFSLGVSRGYKTFSQNLVQSPSDGRAPISDLGKFSIAGDASKDASRFSPRIVIDESQNTGRSRNAFAGDTDDRVDVGGAYRVTRNLDVTAGVRYSQERERLVPPVSDGGQDSQAVYVGTQIRF